MRIERITDATLGIYLNLSHAYEAEFSSLTRTLPNADGLFKPQTAIDDTHTGYLAYEDNLPAGFLVFAHGELQDVSEFYTVPVFRRRQVGIRLAHFVFRTHPGRWQTRELIGADHSTAFWRKTISALVGDAYEEEIVPDSQWGRVTRQRFTIPLGLAVD